MFFGALVLSVEYILIFHSWSILNHNSYWVSLIFFCIMCLTFFNIVCLAFIPEGTPRFSFIHLLLSIAGGWSWNSNTLATWCEELTHLKRPWCWERLRVGGEGDNRGWDGWMTSLTQWTWVQVDSRSWWWTGRPGVLWFTGSQGVWHDWATELNWTELIAGGFTWKRRGGFRLPSFIAQLFLKPILFLECINDITVMKVPFPSSLI